MTTELSRRNFLQLGASVGMLLGLSRFKWVEAATLPDYKALVCVFMLGGNDGHNTVVSLDSTQYNAYVAARGALALPQSQLLGIAGLSALLLSDNPPLSWGSHNYLAPYCFASNCGVGPVLLQATAPRLKAVPEQQFLILSNQIDNTQVFTTFFPNLVTWVNAMRTAYCATRELNGVQYFLPAISQDIHVISLRNELYTARPVDGVIMRDWLASDFSAPDTVVDQVEEGTLVQDYPGVMPFDCPVAP